MWTSVTYGKGRSDLAQTDCNSELDGESNNETEDTDLRPTVQKTLAEAALDRGQ